MGVARLAAPLWAAITLVAAAGGAPVPWAASALALLAALFAGLSRSEPLAAGALALGAAPLWTATTLEASTGALVVSLGALALLVLARPTLPRALPWALLGLGLVLAARQLAASAALPAAGAQALGLAGAGLTLGGLTAGARRARGEVVGLALAGALGLGQSALALRAPLEDLAAVERADARGVLRWRLDTLASSPELGLQALGLDPGFHALALRLWPRVGPEALLKAGWWPERAALSSDERLSLAELLDARGEGGRALRLLRGGRSDLRVRWQHELLARRLGSGGEWAGPAPEGVPTLPDELTLSWGLFTNGTRVLDVHASAPLGGLSLQLVGTPCEGAPTLLLSVDATPPKRVDVPELPAWVSLEQPLGAGPHRLTVLFDGDLEREDCDRNVWVMGLRGA